MMQSYKLPDGSEVEADPGRQDHAEWLKASGAQPLSSPLKAIGSKLAEGMARAPFLFNDLLKVGLDVGAKRISPSAAEESTIQFDPTKLLGKPATDFLTRKLTGVSQQALDQTDPVSQVSYKDFRENLKGSNWTDEALAAAGTGWYKPETKLDQYLGAAAEGAGGGLAGPLTRLAAPTARVLDKVPMLGRMFRPERRAADLVRSTAQAALPGAAAAGAAGGLAAQGATDITGNPLIGMAAGVLGGGLTGAALNWTSAPKAALARSGQAHTNADFETAAKNLSMFERSGSKTATLGEAFPGNSPFLDRTSEALDQEGSNRLIARFGQRKPDMQALSNRALDAVRPETNSIAVANEAAKASKARLKQFDKLATDVDSRRMAKAGPLDPDEVGNLHRQLLKLGEGTQSEIEKDALEAVADKLLQANTTKVQVPKLVRNDKGRWITVMTTEERRLPKTDPQAVLDDLKQLQESLTAQANSQTGGTKLDSKRVRTAYKMVQDFVYQAQPAVGLAERGYAKVKRMLSNPGRESPLKTMAGAENFVDRPAAVSRLSALVDKQTPESIGQTLNSVSKGAPENPNLIGEIARTLLQERTATGTGDLATRLIGGEAGSEMERRTRAMLQAAGKPKGAAGPNMGQFDDSVETLRLLNRIDPGQSSGGAAPTGKLLQSSGTSWLVNPLYMASLLSSQAARKRNYGEIAALLASPTQENLAILLQLKKTDPTLFSRLGIGGGMMGANVETNQEGK